MLTTNNGAGIISGANIGNAMNREKKKYVVTENTHIRIDGKRVKSGDKLNLYPDDTDTKYLLGQKYIELVEKEKPKVELDPDECEKIADEMADGENKITEKIVSAAKNVVAKIKGTKDADGSD